jgi:hypothetical protein
MATNLPPKKITDSAKPTQLFFDTYGRIPLEFPATEVDAVLGFFTSKGYTEEAAQVTGLTLLKQAKLDNTPIFELLDTLGKFTGLQLSALISEILNNNRVPTSTLGFRTPSQNTIKLRETDA